MKSYLSKSSSALKSALPLLLRRDALRSMATWPKFSITSFNMVSRLKSQGLTPGCILDVGANAGQFAVACAKLWPGSQVHSFEAMPDCAEQLKRNVSSLENVHVYPLALGEYEGEISFHVNAQSHSSSVLPLAEAHLKAFPDARESHEITVEISTLDRYFSETSLPGPVLLKLDVQGYEPQVLEGAVKTMRQVDYVVLEASFKPMYQGERLFMDINELMEDIGFRFDRPVSWLEAPETGEILQMDGLFVTKGRG